MSFRRFLWDQERELWDIFQDLDKNEDGRLDAVEMRAALSRSGIDITQTTVEDLVRFLASGSGTSAPSSNPNQPENMYITFSEFRDFLIMLPRKATPFEIYKCRLLSTPQFWETFSRLAVYQVRKRFSDGRGAARVDKEGDLNVSFPKAPISPPKTSPSSVKGKEKEDDFGDTVDEDLWGAVIRIYGDGGGLRAFWVGNGLNVTKIFPVS